MAQESFGPEPCRCRYNCIMMEFIESMIPMGVSGMLAFSGLLHALPGPTLKMQSKEMGMPQWFIMCAGLLMLTSGALYFLKPSVGIFAVAVCMGGSFATASKMPVPQMRPCGMAFSSLTLFATFWVIRATLSLQVIGISTVAFVAGIAGRIYAIEHPLFVKHLSPLDKLSDQVSAKFMKSDKSKKTDGTSKEATKDSDKKGQAAGSGARKRAESPGARSKDED